jgi:sirohydrochlorin cobaltochelatase
LSAPGLILFAHGARDARWAAPFQAVVRHIARQRPHLQVRLAFLEFMAPDLHAAARELCAAGCPSVDVLPMFLGTGGHLRKDLPPLLDRLRAEFPAVRWTLHAAIGEHDAVAAAMATAALALLPDDSTPTGAAR